MPIKMTDEIRTGLKNTKSAIRFGIIAIEKRKLESIAMHFRLEELVMLETIIDEWENYKEKTI